MLLSGWRKRILVPVIGTLFLSGCVTAKDSATIVVCGTVTTVSKETQRRAAEELESLPADSVLSTVVVPDWVRSRDEARACRKGSGDVGGR